MTVSPLEVFAGPAAALLATVFLSIVVIAVCNFRFIKSFGLYMFLKFHFIFLGSVFWFLISVLFLGSILFFGF